MILQMFNQMNPNGSNGYTLDNAIGDVNKVLSTRLNSKR